VPSRAHASAYGACLLAGLVAGWWIARRRAVREGLDPRHFDWMAPLTVAAGLLGAWALSRIGGEPEGGRMLLGGLLLAVGAGIAYGTARGLELGRIGDAFAPALALGIAFGRVGCLFAGCCWGKTCTVAWLPAVRFPAEAVVTRHHLAAGLVPPGAPSLAVHPVQAYEAAGALVLAGLCVLLTPRRRVPGEMFLLFGTGYGVLRFLCDFLRADTPPVALGGTLSQWVAAGAVAVCAALVPARRRHFARRGLLARPRTP